MKSKSKALRLGALSVAVAGAMTASHQAVAEVDVSASVAVANMYLWRGLDLGDGDPAVSGDLVVSWEGLYGGTWVSSGDAELGTEYDLFVGYGGELGDFTYDLSFWNYMYPSNDSGDFDTFGELTDAILTLGWGPVSVTYIDNVAGSSGQEYYSISAEYAAFSATVGHHDLVGGAENYTHVDLSYNYNENLSFTVSKVVDGGEADPDPDSNKVKDKTLVVVAYSLPIDIM